MDPVKPVRTAVAGTTATLAKVVFSAEGNWPEIFDLLIHLLQSQEESMRALCFNILGQVGFFVTPLLFFSHQAIACRTHL
jgi:hypothetical protein